MDSYPQLDYTVIRTVVLVLTGLGVVMVMSSSMATSFALSENPWAIAVRQGAMVCAGLFVFWLALRTHPERLRTFSSWFMLASVLLLIAVLIPGIGTGREEVVPSRGLCLVRCVSSLLRLPVSPLLSGVLRCLLAVIRATGSVLVAASHCLCWLRDCVLV